MISYTAHVEVTARRTITVVAPDLPAARRAVTARFYSRPGKITHICETAIATDDPTSGHAALQVLLAGAFLNLDGAPATIGDWASAIQNRCAALRPELNTLMAPAGLRVLPTGIAIANNPAILFLTDLFAQTKWAGGQWNRAIAQIPGATRANLTFAGIRSRAVIAPLPTNPAKRSSPDDTGPNQNPATFAQDLDNRQGNFRTSRRDRWVFSSKRVAPDGPRGFSPAIAAQSQPDNVAACAGSALD